MPYDSNLSYLSQKLGEAAHTILVSDRPARDRLKSAFISFFPAMMDVRSGKVPEPFASEFASICDGLTSKEEREKGEGKIASTVAQMHEDEVFRMARRIVALHIEIDAAQELK
jgi:hypothetical protein